MAREYFLDTCVVFNITKPYRVYEYGGEKGLEDYKHKIEIDLANKIKQLKALGTSYGFNKEISKESLAELAIIIDAKSAELHKINQKANREVRKDYAYFLDIKEAYLNNIIKLNSIALFNKILNGEIKAFITPMTLAEIKNHTSYKNEDNKVGKTFKSDLMLPFINEYFTTVVVKDVHIQRVVAHLSEVLRGKTTKTSKLNEPKVMANDLNSLGEYGDSTIMAEALVYGKNLITENEKDFVGTELEIRDFIKTLNTDIIKHISNAMPYSVQELLANEIPPVTKQTTFVSLKDNSKITSKFSINQQEALFEV